MLDNYTEKQFAQKAAFYLFIFAEGLAKIEAVILLNGVWGPQKNLRCCLWPRWHESNVSTFMKNDSNVKMSQTTDTKDWGSNISMQSLANESLSYMTPAQWAVWERMKRGSALKRSHAVAFRMQWWNVIKSPLLFGRDMRFELFD